MCFKIGGSSSYVSPKTKATDKESEDTQKTKNKQRLLETEGKANGQKLTSEQSRSIRKIFGN